MQAHKGAGMRKRSPNNSTTVKDGLEANTGWSGPLRFLTLIAVIAGLVLLSRSLPFDFAFNRDGLRELVDFLRAQSQGWGALGPAAIVVLGVAGVLLNVPTVLVLIAVSLIYGPVTAIVVTVIYWAIACYAVYLIGQHLGQAFAARCFSLLPKQAAERINGNGFRTVLYLRLMMFAVPPLNWALATLDVSREGYVMASVIGGLPHIILWSVLGPRAIERMLDAQPGWWHAPEIIVLALSGMVMTAVVRRLLPPA